MPTNPAPRALLIATALALILPASTAAQSINVPPGNSEADQYFETVPDGEGNKSLDSTKEPSDVLTPRQIAELEALGEDGAAAAQIAAATAPDGVGKAGGGAATGGTPDEDGVSSASVATSREGLGGLLWVFLIAVAVVAGIYVVVRRRRAGEG